ncbi:MAG: hypothetical protein CVV42_14250 [Candidatus Riflebacteria bacterium HGW-Riflebacteria-2]|jgi:hypothetical protein|nr:MAG: hypothetical protein CVV42_14250 [Candidatus Riflebacteria bacterium HGW-Riflebacteria-2]
MFHGYAKAHYKIPEEESRINLANVPDKLGVPGHLSDCFYGQNLIKLLNSSEENQIVPETFEQLKAELSRHLVSANWPIKPRRELEEQDEPETEDQL